MFSRIIDARHKYSRGHSRRVANLAKEIGRELGFDEEALFKLEISGLLHEAGKVAVLLVIVDKAGEAHGKRIEVMRAYPLASERIVSSIRSLGDLGTVVRHQLEGFDGSGYPDGLSGEEIPIFADSRGRNHVRRDGRASARIAMRCRSNIFFAKCDAISARDGSIPDWRESSGS